MVDTPDLNRNSNTVIMKTTSVQPAPLRALARVLSIATVIACAWTQNACVHTSERQLSPGCNAAKIANMRSFHVRENVGDDNHIAAFIVDDLRKMGKQASSSTAKSAPQKVDAVITYKDQWMWDITMYMLGLDIQLREPGTDAILATSKTVATSLVRKSPKEMVSETMGTLFGRGQP